MVKKSFQTIKSANSRILNIFLKQTSIFALITFILLCFSFLPDKVSANNGSVWTWGDNLYGVLGYETQYSDGIPRQVSDLSEITTIAGGEHHAIALKNNGSVWTWGYNKYGQLGDGSYTDKNTPAQVSGLSGITAIAGGRFHTIALKNDGSVWTWGYNFHGQLGDGTTVTSNTPAQISGLSGITAIAGGYHHTIALKNDGTVWTWGSNAFGELGNGTDKLYSNIPVKVSGLTEIIAIASGGYHTIALKNNGTVWTWGENEDGELGDGTYIEKNIPAQVSGLSGISAIATGMRHTIALKNDGTVWTWGNNAFGQLGDGTTITRNTPVQVLSLSGVVAVAAGIGSYHTLALKDDGSVWIWGQGPLGDGSNKANITYPVQASTLSEIIAIAGGNNYSIAVKGSTNSNIRKIISCDINADKKNEIIFQYQDGTLKYSNELSSLITISGNLQKDIACGDLNHDNKDDITGIASDGSVWYSMDLGSNWENIYGSLSKIFISDLAGNGTGDSAIIGLNSSNNIFVNYTLATSAWGLIDGPLSDIQTGDFNKSRSGNEIAGINKDGYIYYTIELGGNLATWKPIPGVLSKIFVGDINGDGRSDLLGINSSKEIYYTTNLSMWTNIPGSFEYIATGDLNGDKIDDIVGYNSQGEIYYATIVTNPIWINIPGKVTSLITGDFDGDGKHDIAGIGEDGNVYYTTNLSAWNVIK